MIGTDVQARASVCMRYVNSIRGMLIFYDPRLSGMTLIVTVLCVFLRFIKVASLCDAHEKFFLPNTIIKSALSHSDGISLGVHIKLLAPVEASCNLSTRYQNAVIRLSRRESFGSIMFKRLESNATF